MHMASHLRDLLLQELRMAQGNKKIYHLEAYFAKLMSVLKNFNHLGLDDDMDF